MGSEVCGKAAKRERAAFTQTRVEGAKGPCGTRGTESEGREQLDFVLRTNHPAGRRVGCEWSSGSGHGRGCNAEHKDGPAIPFPGQAAALPIKQQERMKFL